MIVPERVHTTGVLDAYVTDSPEDAVAPRATVTPTIWLESAGR